MVALSEQWILCTAMGAVQAVMVDDVDGVLTICPATSLWGLTASGYVHIYGLLLICIQLH